MYKKMIVLRFPPEITDQPLVCSLSREHDLCFNILKAKILPGQEGIMVLEVSGIKKNVTAGLRYLREHGVKVKSVSQEVRRKDDICFQCGACTAICPTNALYLDQETFEVKFDPELCKGCEFCIAICPVRAMELRFSHEKVLV